MSNTPASFYRSRHLPSRTSLSASISLFDSGDESANSPFSRAKAHISFVISIGKKITRGKFPIARTAHEVPWVKFPIVRTALEVIRKKLPIAWIARAFA